MEISVAIGACDGERFLRAQLQSLASQKTLPAEVVVSDDASQDDTLAILESFQANVPFPVRILRNQVRLGVIRNFEQAISHCSGDIIALCDQDDFWYPDKLSRTIEAFYANPDSGLVFTDADIVDEKMRPVGYRLWESIQFTPRRQQMIRDDRAFQALLKRDTVTGATLAFRASLVPVILPLCDEGLHDAWIALIAAALHPLALIDAPTLAYRQHPGQLIGGTKKTLTMRIRKVDQSASLRLQRPERFFQQAIQRLELLEPAPRLKAALALLEQKRDHFQVRAGLPSNRLMRLSPALAELIRLRYHRYSNGLASFAIDLISRRE